MIKTKARITTNSTIVVTIIDPKEITEQYTLIGNQEGMLPCELAAMMYLVKGIPVENASGYDKLDPKALREQAEEMGLFQLAEEECRP